MFWRINSKDFTLRDAELLLLTYLDPILPASLTAFHAWMLTTPTLKSFIEKTMTSTGERAEQIAARLTGALHNHWRKRLQDGDGDAYRARLSIIGPMHARIGVPMTFFIDGYRLLLIECQNRLEPALAKLPQERPMLMAALSGLVLDDLNNIVATYSTVLKKCVMGHTDTEPKPGGAG